MSTPLSEIVTLLDTTLRVAEVRDASVAMNGLQVENNGTVTKVALAVDGSQKSIDDAIAAGPTCWCFTMAFSGAACRLSGAGGSRSSSPA